jgi:GNAT superfamily N-acetyltransferase
MRMRGFTIREATSGDAAGIARVHIESSRATYTGLLPDELVGEMTYERRLANWSETLGAGGGEEFVHVAADDAGRVFGFASGGPEREADADYDGELYAIYLLGTHQRQGAGRRLVGAVAGTLAASGFRSMLVWVLAANPACRFYEALGGARVREKTIERGGVSLAEVGYGWEDVKALRDVLRADA